MKAWGLESVLLFGLLGAVVMGADRALVAKAGESAPQTASKAALPLSAPSAPARMTAEQVVQAIEEQDWSSHLFRQAARVTTHFGSYKPDFEQRVGRRYVAVPVLDVWTVTLEGVNIPTHGPANAVHPDLHTLTFVVADETGRLLFADAS